MDLSKLTILNEQYVLRKALGQPGRYDVTYLAWNLAKEHEAVIVREYHPTHLVTLTSDEAPLEPTGEEEKRLFEYGLNCFEREAAAAGMIDHPNVVKQPTFFRENGTAYTVSAYHPGATLAAVLEAQGGKLSEKAAFAIIMPLLNGLMAGHRKGLIHGRLSPQRIYLTKSGRPMLLRFHVTQILLARRCGRFQDMSVPGYTSLELLIPEGKKGPWSDVYSCAATFYSIVTGLQPPEVRDRIQVDPFPDILDAEKGLSRGLKKVLYRAMSMDCKERPQSILELKQEFLDAMSQLEKPYLQFQQRPERKSTISEIEESMESYPSAKTATELVSLSRRALAHFKITPAAPMSTGDGGPANRNGWLAELIANEEMRQEMLHRDIPLGDTNPMGPFASESAPLAETIGLPESESESPGVSPMQQIFASATASPARKMSITAIAACLIFLAAAGALIRWDEGKRVTSTPESELQQPAGLSGMSQPVYMQLMAQGDSLQNAAESFLRQGDEVMHERLIGEAAAIYEQALAANPEDSVAASRLEALSAIGREEALDGLAQSENASDSLASSGGSNKLAELYMSEADSLYNAGRFDAARQKFRESLKYAPGHGHALAMIAQIDRQRANPPIKQVVDELNDQANALSVESNTIETEQLQSLNENGSAAGDPIDTSEIRTRDAEVQFLALRRQGDLLFEAGNFPAALAEYESAQLLRPDDSFLAVRIAAARDSLTFQERRSQSLDNKFQLLKSKADSLFDAGAYEEARGEYQAALAINAADGHIAERLAAIEDMRTEAMDSLTDENGIFLAPEVPPELLDESELLKQLVYPLFARDNNVEGRVIVRMIVDEEGRTSGHLVAKSIGFGCDDEAVRVLKKARFSPATQHGRPVKTWVNYPIVFQLSP